MTGPHPRPEDILQILPPAARIGLSRRIEAAAARPSKANSLRIDCDRIWAHAQRRLPFPKGKGLKALLRHVRRRAQHPAARACRERIELRGPHAWDVSATIPMAHLGFAIIPLTDSHAMMRESIEMSNCVAEFEEGCHEGHYLAFSLRSQDGRMPRHTLVAAHMGGGEWTIYDVHDSKGGSCRDAKDVGLRVCDALQGWDTMSVRECPGTAPMAETPGTSRGT